MLISPHKYSLGLHSYGPFVKLPEDIQRDAVELFYYFSHLTTPALQALSAICKCA